MRWSGVLLLGGLTAAVAGCHSCDLVEAELRARDHDLRIVQAELERTEAYNQYLQRELHHVQQSVSAAPLPDGSPPPPPAIDGRIKAIVLGRQTGGFEDDGIPGDEALQVVLEPRDADNHTVKAPGSAVVHVFEILPEGVKKPLCNWQVSPDQLQRSWRSGLLLTGYCLVLPWKSWPTIPQLRVVVQFVAEDHRTFEAERDVTVRLTPSAYRKPPPADDTGPSLTPNDPETPLPLPRKLEPEPEKGPGSAPEKKEEENKPKTSVSEKVPIATTSDPPRPLKGAVELLAPVPIPDNP
jgi:hypothetical protein